MKEVKFTQMKDGDEEDYNFLTKHEVEHTKGTANRLLKALVELDQSLSGYKVTRLGHSLQSATRAFHDGADIDWIVSALLHDIGDNLAPSNHADFAATLLQPFVSEKNYWIVKHHGIFQGYYFFEYLGLDKNMRDSFKDHPYFEDCKVFCEKYDQNSFDPDYESLPLDFFIPMIKKVFAKPKNTIYKK